MEMLLTLVLQVALAVVVAKLTLAGSRSQKWWERKAELYAKLVERLYDIHRDYSYWLASRKAYSNQLPPDQEKELTARAKDAHSEVLKLIHIGTFLISDAVHQDLNGFLKGQDDAVMAFAEHRHMNRWVEGLCAATLDCIESVREHAKDDLGLNSRFGRLKRKVQSLLSE
jgi:hypothetical protein